MSSTKLNSKELNQVMDAQEKMVQAALGKSSFEFPGSDQYHQKGDRYQPNATEQAFFADARWQLFRSAAKWTIAGTLVPTVLMSYLRRNPRFAEQFTIKRQAISVGLWGMAGSLWGMSSARVQLASDLSLLQHSPMAIESRYQLWKINPNHPILSSFRSEIKSWSEYQYSRDPITTDNEYNHYTTNYDNKDDITTEKREKFYKNRRKLQGSYQESWENGPYSYPPTTIQRW